MTPKCPPNQQDIFIAKPKRKSWLKQRQEYKPPLPHNAQDLAFSRINLCGGIAQLAICQIEEILYPNGNRDAAWNADTLDAIARVIDKAR